MSDMLVNVLTLRYDQKINVSSATPTEAEEAVEHLATQQFGVTLSDIKIHYNVSIPPVVKQCVEYLDQPDGKNYNCVLLNSNVCFIFSTRD